MERSQLALHLPDADQLTGQEIGAVLELKPAAMLVITYAMWPHDKGVAQSVNDLVHSLKHDRLYVRFHADPNPPAYALEIGGAAEWGKLCAERMTQHYGGLPGSEIRLHAILCNETDAGYEGGLSPEQASTFQRESLEAYAHERPNDILHVAAPTGAPETHRRHLRQYKNDGWLVQGIEGRWYLLCSENHQHLVWIDGHGYNGDLENVLNVLEEECPGSDKVITETNDLHDFEWPLTLLALGKAHDIVYFILNWARGGEGRVQPPNPDDAAKQMSLLRFPDRYEQFKETIGQVIQPEVPVEPVPPVVPEVPVVPVQPEFPIPVDDNGNEWQASTALMQQTIIDIAPVHIDPRSRYASIKLLLACGLAEAGSRPGFEFQSQERWHIWTDHGREAVRQRNWGYAAQVLGWGRDVGTIGTNDYSAGPFHQAMAWWDEFPGDPTDPNDPYRWDVNLWLLFRKRFIQDHTYATIYAARRLKAYYDQRPHDLQWVLERYNKPNDDVSDGVRANYARALVLAETWLQAWGMTVDGGIPAPDPSVPDMRTRFESYLDPEPAGTFSRMPRGIILHGSRSGRGSNTLQAEYAGTANYEVNNTAGLGWNATIGPGVAAIHIDARRWGWNASAASRDYIAVEIAQPLESVDITDSQVQALCDYIRHYVLPIWPNLPMHFPTHAEVEHSGETGSWYGKTDVFSFGSWKATELRERIIANLEGPQPGHPLPPGVPETDQQKITRLIEAVGYIGGDVADKLEAVRAGVDDGMGRPYEGMSQEAAVAALAAWWDRWDVAYQEIGNIGSEIRRVRDEQLK